MTTDHKFDGLCSCVACGKERLARGWTRDDAAAAHAAASQRVSRNDAPDDDAPRPVALTADERADLIRGAYDARYRALGVRAASELLAELDTSKSDSYVKSRCDSVVAAHAANPTTVTASDVALARYRMQAHAGAFAFEKIVADEATRVAQQRRSKCT